MNSKSNKNFASNKKQIRNDIIASAIIFKNNLANKYVLYIFDDNTYIEVYYRKSSFSHLTGIKTGLNAFDFYDKCVNKQLSTQQFTFDKNVHPYDLAKKKTSRLNEITKFIKNDLIVLKGLQTNSCVYKFSLTDTDLTLCFSQNMDKNTGKKIDEYYIPASFRVGDDSVAKSNNALFVEYIFSKSTKGSTYYNLCFGDPNKITNLPDFIKSKLDLVKLQNQETIT